MIKREILLNSQNIAVVRTDKLGDIVLTLPLCNAIKQNIPNAKLTVIANSYTEPILKKIPIIDNIIFVDKYNNGIRQIFQDYQFDAIFFPRPRFEEAFAGFLSNAKLRIGSGYRLYSFFFNFKIWEHRKKGTKHEAEYNVGLLENILDKKIQVTFPEIIIPEEIKNKIEKKLTDLNINKKYVIIHPGSGGSSYDWSPANFGKLSEKIIIKYDIDVLITGVKYEKEICEKVLRYSNFKARNVCGLFTLDEMIALLKNTKLLVTNSTGVLHIASMFNVPIIGLYPNTSHLSKRRWGPLNNKSLVITPKFKDNKDKDNMDLISVEDVLKATEKVIEL